MEVKAQLIRWDILQIEMKTNQKHFKRTFILNTILILIEIRQIVSSYQAINFILLHQNKDMEQAQTTFQNSTLEHILMRSSGIIKWWHLQIRTWMKEILDSGMILNMSSEKQNYLKEASLDHNLLIQIFWILMKRLNTLKEINGSKKDKLLKRSSRRNLKKMFLKRWK